MIWKISFRLGKPSWPNLISRFTRALGGQKTQGYFERVAEPINKTPLVSWDVTTALCFIPTSCSTWEVPLAASEHVFGVQFLMFTNSKPISHSFPLVGISGAACLERLVCLSVHTQNIPSSVCSDYPATYKNNPSGETYMKYIHRSTPPGSILANLNCELWICLDQWWV